MWIKECLWFKTVPGHTLRQFKVKAMIKLTLFYQKEASSVFLVKVASGWDVLMLFNNRGEVGLEFVESHSRQFFFFCFLVRVNVFSWAFSPDPVPTIPRGFVPASFRGYLSVSSDKSLAPILFVSIAAA